MASMDYQEGFFFNALSYGNKPECTRVEAEINSSRVEDGGGNSVK